MTNKVYEVDICPAPTFTYWVYAPDEGTALEIARAGEEGKKD
jgi:hypothetical protein